MTIMIVITLITKIKRNMHVDVTIIIILFRTIVQSFQFL